MQAQVDQLDEHNVKKGDKILPKPFPRYRPFSPTDFFPLDLEGECNAREQPGLDGLYHPPSNILVMWFTIVFFYAYVGYFLLDVHLINN